MVLAELSSTNPPSQAERDRIAAALVSCADSDDPGPGTPSCRPLAAALPRGIGANDPREHSWEALLTQSGQARFAVLHHEGQDMSSRMRTIARLFDDPVLDLTLSLFEQRYRQALPEPPPAAVLDWLHNHWG